jgi:ubiquinone/menaquinone biosynthesis C-methylase UbiE
LPTVSVEAFAGVSNVGVSATIPAAGTVLDVGCGAGLDSLVAARRVGPGGIVAGIDFSDAMLRRARRAATLSELTIALCRGDAEHLPLARDSVDVALVNGIFNLNPARTQIFEELARVVRPGGAVYAAELVLMEAVSRPVRFTEAEWFA